MKGLSVPLSLATSKVEGFKISLHSSRVIKRGFERAFVSKSFPPEPLNRATIQLKIIKIGLARFTIMTTFARHDLVSTYWVQKVK